MEYKIEKIVKPSKFGENAIVEKYKGGKPIREYKKYKSGRRKEALKKVYKKLSKVSKETSKTYDNLKKKKMSYKSGNPLGKLLKSKGKVPHIPIYNREKVNLWK